MKVTYIPTGGSSTTLCDHSQSVSNVRNTPVHSERVVPHIGTTAPGMWDDGNFYNVLSFEVAVACATLAAAERMVAGYAQTFVRTGAVTIEYATSDTQTISGALLRVTGLYMRGIMVFVTYEIKGVVS